MSTKEIEEQFEDWRVMREAGDVAVRTEVSTENPQCKVRRGQVCLCCVVAGAVLAAMTTDRQYEGRLYVGCLHLDLDAECIESFLVVMCMDL